MKMLRPARTRPSLARIARLALVGIIVAGAAASVCQPDTGEPDFTVLQGPNPAPLLPGATGSVDFQITPINGLNTGIDISLYTGQGLVRERKSPAPAKANAVKLDNFATVDAITVPAGGTSAHVVFHVDAEALPGAHTLSLVFAIGEDPFGVITGHQIDVPVTVLTPPPASYTISIQTGPITVPANTTSAADIVMITRTNFTGAITLSGAGPAGSGITVTVPTSGQPGSGDQGSFTVNVPSGLAPGTYIVTLTASATGLTPVPATVGVIVPGYTLAAQFASVSTAAGTTAPANVITVTRSNFTGPITLTGTSDDGILVDVVPLLPTTGNQFTLTERVPSSAGVRTHVIALTATSPGLENVTTQFNLVVGAPASNVSYVFCPAIGVPVWAAIQDGASTAAWTMVSPSGSTYAFNIGSGRGGIAYVTQDVNGTVLHIFYGTQAQLQLQGTSHCANTGATSTVIGSVTNVGTAAQVYLGLGSSTTAITPPATTFQLSNVEPGPLDLVAATLTGSSPRTSIKMLLRRSVNTPDLGALNFAGTEAFIPARASLLFPQPLAIGASYYLHSANGFLTNYYADFASGVSSFPVFGLPTLSLGDLHYATAQSYSGTGNTTQYQIAGVMFGAVVDQSMTFGGPLSTPTITVLNAPVVPYARLQASLPTLSPYTKLYETNFSQSFGSNHVVVIQMTGDYAAGSNPVLMAIPDFTATAGWSNSYGPLKNFLTHWIVTASGWSTTGGVTFPLFAAGTTFNSATKQDDITP